MPRTTGGRKTAGKRHKSRTGTKYKVCATCGKEKQVTTFYRSDNPKHDGYLPICKECLKEQCINIVTKEINLDKFKATLKQVDKPYLEKYYVAARGEYESQKALNPSKVTNEGEIIGKYFKYLSTLKQIRFMSWNDGLIYADKIERGEISAEPKKQIQEKIIANEEKIREARDLFGVGYSVDEYLMMLDKYKILKEDFPSLSGGQRDLLFRYIKYSVKEEMAVRRNEVGDIEKWAKLSTEAYKRLVQSDLQGNISSFSEFFQKLERTKDVIRIMPKFKYRPNDAADFIIWCYVNYIRRLEGKEEVEYADVYKFYDKKVEEYTTQYGDPYEIFTEDTTKNNREKIEAFIKVPADYYGDEGNDE